MSAHQAPSGNDFAAGFLDDYFAECEEHLTLVGRALLALSLPIGRIVSVSPRVTPGGGIAFEFLVSGPADTTAFEPWRTDWSGSGSTKGRLAQGSRRRPLATARWRKGVRNTPFWRRPTWSVSISSGSMK